MSEGEFSLKIGLPSGSLEKATLALFAKAGWRVIGSARSYKPVIDDPELEGRFLRAQEISRYVEMGHFDCGLCGYDWVVENGSDVVEVCELPYSKTSNNSSRWVLVVPESSAIHEIEDLRGKRIATELVRVTERYLETKGVEAEVEFSWGATEGKVPDLVDAIVDITETGASIRANQLRIVETLLETSTRLIANRESWEDRRKREKIETIALLLRAALEAEGKVGLKLNCRRGSLDSILKDLPALRNPTVSQLADPEWVALETIIDETVVREIIPFLKANGAEGIIEYALNKVVY